MNLLDELLGTDETPEATDETTGIDRQKLGEEIDLLERLADRARRIGVDTKSQTLPKALEIGFDQLTQLEQRLAQRTETETLFTIRWAVV